MLTKGGRGVRKTQKITEEGICEVGKYVNLPTTKIYTSKLFVHTHICEQSSPSRTPVRRAPQN